MTSDHAEPRDSLDADEPTTPLWVTALGASLFLLAGIFFLVTAEPDAPPPSPGDSNAQPAAEEAPAAEAAPSPAAE